MDFAKDTNFNIAVVPPAFTQRMKAAVAAWMLVVVSAPVTAQFQDEMPHIVFWTNMMGADSNISQQVSQYATSHNLRRLPNSYSRLLSNTTTLNGMSVYTASPDDVLCGAPAGAVATVSIRVLANKDDLLSLPEVQAHQSRSSALEKDAQVRAARSTQQQEAILRDAQGGYASKAQKGMARIYEQQLAGSLSQHAQKQSAEQAVNKYAATINNGFAQMSMKERCVWAMGAFIAQNSKSLDEAFALANKRAASQTTSTSLGFGRSTNAQPAMPFDMSVAMNTVKAAMNLERLAFQRGSANDGSTD